MCRGQIKSTPGKTSALQAECVALDVTWQKHAVAPPLVAPIPTNFPEFICPCICRPVISGSMSSHPVSLTLASARNERPAGIQTHIAREIIFVTQPLSQSSLVLRAKGSIDWPNGYVTKMIMRVMCVRVPGRSLQAEARAVCGLQCAGLESKANGSIV